jgi:hypothetical protein
LYAIMDWLNLGRHRENKKDCCDERQMDIVNLDGPMWEEKKEGCALVITALPVKSVPDTDDQGSDVFLIQTEQKVQRTLRSEELFQDRQ